MDGPDIPIRFIKSERVASWFIITGRFLTQYGKYVEFINTIGYFIYKIESADALSYWNDLLWSSQVIQMVLQTFELSYLQLTAQIVLPDWQQYEDIKSEIVYLPRCRAICFPVM